MTLANADASRQGQSQTNGSASRHAADLRHDSPQDVPVPAEARGALALAAWNGEGLDQAAPQQVVISAIFGHQRVQHPFQHIAAKRLRANCYSARSENHSFLTDRVPWQPQQIWLARGGLSGVRPICPRLRSGRSECSPDRPSRTRGFNPLKTRPAVGLVRAARVLVQGVVPVCRST